MNHTLEKNILATITYFDVFNYPLTLFELKKYIIDIETLSGNKRTLVIPISLEEIERSVNDLIQRGLVKQANGLYCLKNREELTLGRIEQIKISMDKIRRARKVLFWLTFLPFVRGIAITGRLSTKTAKAGSDWDVLIVLKHGHIWLGRMIVTGFLHILGKRRHGDYTKDRVCLNHFLTDKSLEIRVKDLFAAKEYTFAIPLYGKAVFEKFRLQNSWISDFFPHTDSVFMPNRLMFKERKFVQTFQSIFEWLLGFAWLEKQVSYFQKRKIQTNPKTQGVESYIYANDDALIFLPSPQGPKVFEKFMEKLSSLKSR